MTYDTIKSHKKPGFSRSLEDFSKNYSASVLNIKHFIMWKLIYCFLKTTQDFLFWITFTLVYLPKTRCFYIPRKKTFVTTNKRLFTLQNQFLFASNPISVCICCCCCANKACIRCCIISYYWLCWLIADLHFLFIQVFLNFALFFFQFTSFSSNYLTYLFELFPGNIVNIKGFLVVLSKNCLSSFVYHVLFRSQPLLRSRISCRKI